MRYLIFTLMGLFAVFLGGCASRQQAIVFSDMTEVRPAAADRALPPAQRTLTAADNVQIERAVFSYLLEHPLGADEACSAIFLQADEGLEQALIGKYSRHQPPVKPGSHAALSKGRTPMDRDTLGPAMVLSVDICEPESADSTIALGRWYARGSLAGFYTFALKKSGNDWVIQSVH